MHKGTWFRADGRVEQVIPANRKAFSYDELSRFVGGYIENVQLTHGTMYANEEGLLLGLKPNVQATSHANADKIWHGQAYLVGDVIFYTGNGSKKE